jgi:dGTPase
MDSEQDVVDWVFEPLGSGDRDRFRQFEKQDADHHKALRRSFDCSIMSLADDVAYGVHDLEDAIALRLMSEEHFREFVSEEKCSSYLTKAKEKNPGESLNGIYQELVEGLFGDGGTRKRFISRMVHHLLRTVRLRRSTSSTNRSSATELYWTIDRNSFSIHCKKRFVTR